MSKHEDPNYVCPWTHKSEYSYEPDFSGLDPDTGLPWSPVKVVQLLGIKKASNDQTREACQKVLAGHPDKVAAYRAGKQNLIGFFIKLVMDETQRQADPKVTSEVLREILAKDP